MRRPDNIAFGVNDPLPPRLALGLALQQLAFLGALMVIPDIYARASGLPESDAFLNIASATLLVSALVIVLQVRALRYLGAGYYYPLQTTGAVLPGMYLVASLPGSGLDAVFGMVWVVGLTQIGFSFVNDGLIHLGTVRHLHHAHTATFVVEHFRCDFLQDFYGHRRRACREIVNSIVLHTTRS